MKMFVSTKASAVKKNAKDSHLSVVFCSRSKKNLSQNGREETLRNMESSSQNDLPDMKKLRYEIIKFGTSGFSGTLKEDANIALMVSLGAERPKNRGINYKELLQRRKESKTNRDSEVNNKYKSLPLKIKPGSKIKKTGKKKHVKGLLDVYGEVKQKKNGKK